MHTVKAAERVHGDGEAAHRIAFGSLKHFFEMVGDHWEAEDERGPSDGHPVLPDPKAVSKDSAMMQAGTVDEFLGIAVERPVFDQF